MHTDLPKVHWGVQTCDSACTSLPRSSNPVYKLCQVVNWKTIRTPSTSIARVEFFCYHGCLACNLLCTTESQRSRIQNIKREQAIPPYPSANLAVCYTSHPIETEAALRDQGNCKLSSIVPLLLCVYRLLLTEQTFFLPEILDLIRAISSAANKKIGPNVCKMQHLIVASLATSIIERLLEPELILGSGFWTFSRKQIILFCIFLVHL